MEQATDYKELPMLIKRCLTYGVIIYPYQLPTILSQYELRKIPDKYLSLFNRDKIEKYIKGLYLCGQEMANDWTKGFELLKELGFVEESTTEGHRKFLSLAYEYPEQIDF